MFTGSLAILSTALAAGVLVTAPLAVAENGADDSPAQVAADDGTGRADGGAALARGGGNDRDVRVTRRCSASSTAKLKLSPEDGRVEVEFEVDENRNGSTWGVTLTRNGTRILSRSAVTKRPSGSFEVRRVTAAGSPRTTVVAVARRAATGETCRVTATL